MKSRTKQIGNTTVHLRPSNASTLLWSFTTATSMQVNNDWKEFVELLNRHQVDYVLIGSHALSFHGVSRLTQDIDFIVRSSEENAKKIVVALNEFGFGSLGLSVEDFTELGAIIQLGHPPNRIDILNRIDGVEFDQIWATREPAVFAGLDIWIISKPLLKQNKLAAGRPKDLGDASLLD